MKKLLIALCLLNALVALAADPAPAASIHRDIDKLVALYTDGFGHNEPKWRHVAFGPLFDPKSTDAVAFFSVAGIDLTNGLEEYIAIFAQGQGRSTPIAKERPYRLVATAQIGTRWARTLRWDTARISQGQIVVQGTRWAAKDAGCCPTELIEVIFTVAIANAGDTSYPLLRQSEKSGRSPATPSPLPGTGPGRN